MFLAAVSGKTQLLKTQNTQQIQHPVHPGHRPAGCCRVLPVTTSIRGAWASLGVVALSLSLLLLLSPEIFADKPQLFQIRTTNQAGSPVKVYWPGDGSEGGVTSHQRLLDFCHQHDPSKATAEQTNKLLAKYSAEQIANQLQAKPEVPSACRPGSRGAGRSIGSTRTSSCLVCGSRRCAAGSGPEKWKSFCLYRRAKSNVRDQSEPHGHHTKRGALGTTTAHEP